MTIYICIGSSCHLKGSYDIINLFKENVKKYKLENSVNLTASFCLGMCSLCNNDGVSVKFNEENVSITKENFDQIFKKYVLNELT
ncbi:MAG: (2Fe-2S) ferredoxin domain-containing protein [Oscillospiraceae bacterium]